MQLVIDKSFLQTATSRLTGAISERGLANIFLQVTDRAEISASDMMFSVVSYFDSEVIQKGRCFVPAKLFCDIVKELPNGQVKILTDTNFMTLIGGALDEFQIRKFR
jgi:DNA polymerase-3 subunit beta